MWRVCDSAKAQSQPIIKEQKVLIANSSSYKRKSPFLAEVLVALLDALVVLHLALPRT